MAVEQGDKIEAALKEAATPDKDSPPESEASEEETEVKAEEAETEESESSDSKKGNGKWIPKSRFDEVNEARKDALGKLESLEEKLEKFSARETRLDELQSKLEESEDLIGRIKALANSDNEAVKNAVITVDKALQGIVEEVESGEKTAKQGEKEISELLKTHKEELNEVVANEKAEILLQRANDLRDRYFDGLPEEYSKEEKALLEELFVSRVDWDAIEETPSRLNELVGEAIQKTIDAYGEPKGAILAKVKVEEEKATEPEESNTDKLKRYLDVNWGELDDKGNPKFSDEDMSAVLARAMRLSKEG